MRDTSRISLSVKLGKVQNVKRKLKARKEYNPSINSSLKSENPIQEMYDNLESILKENLEQWYFLHEEIPFMDE